MTESIICQESIFRTFVSMPRSHSCNPY